MDTRWTGAAILVIGPIELDCDRYTVQVEGRPVELTRMEFDLLEYLARHSNRVVSHAELLAEVAGRIAGESGSLIRVHVAHLRRKLGFASTLIQTVRGRGFLLRASSGSASEATSAHGQPSS